VQSTADVTAPTAPATLTGSAGDGSVSLSWAPSASTDTTAYRVYRRTPPGVWMLSATTPATGVSIGGLPNGAYVLLAVTAVDAAGNESAKSSVIALLPTPAPAPPVPTPTPTPTPQPIASPASAFALGALRLVGRPRACTRRCGAPARLEFSLSAAATVQVTAARRTCTNGGRCSYRTAARVTTYLTSGDKRLSVAPKLADTVALRAGSYRVTVRAGARRRTLSLTVARG
jgi:hypothetical protein